LISEGSKRFRPRSDKEEAAVELFHSLLSGIESDYEPPGLAVLDGLIVARDVPVARVVVVLGQPANGVGQMGMTVRFGPA
jgi:hypothetical protein